MKINLRVYHKPYSFLLISTATAEQSKIPPLPSFTSVSDFSSRDSTSSLDMSKGPAFFSEFGKKAKGMSLPLSHTLARSHAIVSVELPVCSDSRDPADIRVVISVPAVLWPLRLLLIYLVPLADVLTKDYSSDQKFTVSSESATGLVHYPFISTFFVDYRCTVPLELEPPSLLPLLLMVDLILIVSLFL